MERQLSTLSPELQIQADATSLLRSLMLNVGIITKKAEREHPNTKVHLSHGGDIREDPEGWMHKGDVSVKVTPNPCCSQDSLGKTHPWDVIVNMRSDSNTGRFPPEGWGIVLTEVQGDKTHRELGRQPFDNKGSVTFPGLVQPHKEIQFLLATRLDPQEPRPGEATLEKLM
ncbi:MAG: hypothetical protein ABH950_04605 [Candidatus Altiarchaeota archaeon]